jgi:hypothetical protein
MRIGQIKQRLLTLQVTVIVLAVFVMLMGASLVLQRDTMEEWRHIINFLTIWIKQNNLEITPTI